MLKFGNKEFRNIQEQVEKNAKDIEKLIEEGSELPPEKPTDNGQILLGNINGSVEWSTETIREFQHELVSGENIKTINGVSILGSGNIQIKGGGNFNPQDPVTDNGQILVGSIDGTYSWSTQTIQEIWNTADGANTTANNNTTNIAVLDTKVNTATNSITALDTRVTTLEQTTATKTYVDEQIQAKLNGSY